MATSQKSLVVGGGPRSHVRDEKVFAHTMLIEPHQFRWIDDNLVDNHIAFVVIGGVAVKFYCPSRRTKDLDLFVGADPTMVDRLVAAIPQLRRDPNARAKLLSDKVGHLQVDIPYSIDILTFAPALAFEDALRTAEQYEQNGMIVPILSRSLLIAHKEAIGDRKDLEDVWLLSEKPTMDRAT